jgi:hypothetical protein
VPEHIQAIEDEETHWYPTPEGFCDFRLDAQYSLGSAVGADKP